MCSRCRCPITLLGLIYLVTPLLAAEATVASTPPYRVVVATPPAPALACAADSVFVSMRSIVSSPPNLDHIAQSLQSTVHGVSVADIVSFCRANSVAATAMTTNMLGLRRIGAPMILYVNRRHFIVYLGELNGRLRIFDNALGLIDCAPDWFAKAYAWDGTSILIGPMPLSVAVQLHGRAIAYALVVICALLLLFSRRLIKRQPRFVNPDIA
jgi:hypothetical protein